MREFASGVHRLPIAFVNAYFVNAPDGKWVLVDSGLPHTAGVLRAKAQELYGSNAKPEAIVLTHGHFDHAGSARELAEAWNVPIYAHRLELPYLSGQSNYPPHDPTLGGAIAFLSRFMSGKTMDLGPHLQALPEGDEVEISELPGWKIIFAPGHSPGHVALWNPEQRTLLVGDAFATVDMDSWIGMTTFQQKLGRAGAPFNCDWGATKRSVEKLAALRPRAVGCGHGHPISADDNPFLADDLENFAHDFPLPEAGRYAHQPAQTDNSGVLSVPPPAPDPLPGKLAIGAAAFLAFKLLRKRKGR